jgi:fused signal recognition particle receptor
MEKKTFWGKIKSGFSSSQKDKDLEKAPADVLLTENREVAEKKKNFFSLIGDNLKSILSKKKLTNEVLDLIEETLILADVGVETSLKLRQHLSKIKLDQDVTDLEVKEILASEIEKILSKVEKPIPPKNQSDMMIAVVIGVNGAGKTTTISKLSNHWLKNNKKIGVVAGDTFRAGAKEQLEIWSKRLNVDFYSSEQEVEPASLVYTSIEKAKQANTDILIIDTAGRLHNKKNLMSELEKIIRTIKKIDDKAPHEIILVLDATVGQNAYNQVESFKNSVDISGLIITKLDGTAKGGIVIGLSEKYSIPIYAVGNGEKPTDLIPFCAKTFTKNLLGIE